MATITIKDLEKVYPGADSATIKNANLEIKDKEFIVLVGPSGCGKSSATFDCPSNFSGEPITAFYRLVCLLVKHTK